MKLRNIVAVVAIALLLASAIGFSGMKVFAQTSQPVATAQVQNAPAIDTEVAGPDTDTVDEQVGDQNAVDTGAETVGPEEDKSADLADAAPTGTPVITADAAQKTAESFLNAGAAIKVELDDENGALVYSVEFANDTDVKVDAMTGSVLGSESGKD